MVTILSGTKLSAAIRRKVARDLKQLQDEAGVTPGLAVILLGEDPASQIYVRKKVAQSEQVGIKSIQKVLPPSTAQEELLELISALNSDATVHGILVQLPLPEHIDSAKVLDAIDPGKDVDGFHPVNVGRLSAGTGGLIPCTPLGCMRLLDEVVDDFRGKVAVVIGSSNIVGKPVALLLLERGCTVTVAHKLTQDLITIARTADILVVAVGKPGLVRGSWAKPGAIVIDVGINRVADPDGVIRLVGDVAADEMDHAGYLTPVPGGVGPMTIACLLSNTVKAARNSVAAETA